MRWTLFIWEAKNKRWQTKKAQIYLYTLSTRDVNTLLLHIHRDYLHDLYSRQPHGPEACELLRVPCVFWDSLKNEKSCSTIHIFFFEMLLGQNILDGSKTIFPRWIGESFWFLHANIVYKNKQVFNFIQIKNLLKKILLRKSFYVINVLKYLYKRLYPCHFYRKPNKKYLFRRIYGKLVCLFLR